MTHPLAKMGGMNSLRRAKKISLPLALSWSHAGVTYRVTAWPEVSFERLYGDEWIAAQPSEEALASAAQTCGPLEWRPYLEFVPADVKEFLARFRITRMEALQVIARCPALLQELTEFPALTGYVAAHMGLRGTPGPGWDEINAVYERSGIYGVLEWLGLPASRQTLAILGNVADPELPKKLLEPLRTLLWEPGAIFALQRVPVITDKHLLRCCHPLAA
jgi:hypothetical protein